MKRNLLIFVVVISMIPSMCYAKAFVDVPETSPCYKAVSELRERGIVQGGDDGYFRPDDSTTRAEFCAFVSRVNGYIKVFKSNRTMPFIDVSKKEWFEPFVLYCYEKGYINGVKEDKFAPEDNVTCEQAIKIIVSAYGAEEIPDGQYWYSGYIETAEKEGLLKDAYYEIGMPAKRSFVAQLIYNYAELKDTGEEVKTFAENDYAQADENYNYERPEYIYPVEIDYEQQMRDQLGINYEEKEKPRYDENSERTAGM